MKEIELSQGYVALVDDEDYGRCMEGRKWCAEVRRYKDGSIWNVYAQRTMPKINGKRLPSQRLHSFITGRKGDDHIDGNGLNNQRYNLRPSTQSQNVRSQRVRKDNISGYKGVYWNKEKNKWAAQIKVNKKKIHLGYFQDILDAARAYNVAARKYYGEFALINAVPDLV